MPKRVVRHAVEQPQDQSIRRIPLTQGQHTTVDASDYDWLMRHNWHARRKQWGFYATRNVPLPDGRQTTVDMHREILGLKFGATPTGDHINRDTLDNRRANLRLATASQQVMNQGVRVDSSTGYRGVTQRGNKWRAKINLDGKQISLGYGSTPEEVHALYRAAAEKYFGEYAGVQV